MSTPGSPDRVDGGMVTPQALQVAIDNRLGHRIQPVSKRHMYYYICSVIGGDVDLVDHEENIDVAWCTLDEVYEHFEELAQIPDVAARTLPRRALPKGRSLVPDQVAVPAEQGLRLRQQG